LDSTLYIARVLEMKLGFKVMFKVLGRTGDPIKY
jgi:hypothetical protein